MSYYDDILNMKRERNNIKPSFGILTFSMKETSTTLENFIKIIKTSSSANYIVAGGSINTINEEIGSYYHIVDHKQGRDTFKRVINFVYTQIKLSYELFRIGNAVKIWLFFGGPVLSIPMLTAKLLGKKVIQILAISSLSSSTCPNSNISQFGKVIDLVGNINLILADRICVVSQKHVQRWNLEKYLSKISIFHEHFIDFGLFNRKKELDGRDILVGYIGGLRPEKGILNFLEAITKIISVNKNVKFIIGGGGQLQDEVIGYLDKKTLGDYVNYVGWIPHDKLPVYLNEIKLFVIPSYTESGPLTLLEAIACGTPVLGTPVGLVPDVIKDSETGFIMEDNSPECIARNIIRALDHPDLEEITKNARALVEKEFTYEAAVERYKKMLENFEGGT